MKKIIKKKNTILLRRGCLPGRTRPTGTCPRIDLAAVYKYAINHAVPGCRRRGEKGRPADDISEGRHFMARFRPLRVRFNNARLHPPRLSLALLRTARWQKIDPIDGRAVPPHAPCRSFFRNGFAEIKLPIRIPTPTPLLVAVVRFTGKSCEMTPCII